MTYYTPEDCRKIKEEWIARIESWQNSGLSGAAWCRQENIVYHQFTYWKKRLIVGDHQILDPSSFVELSESSEESSGIEIIIHELSIRVSRNFDSLTLHRCIKALREQC